MNLECHYCQALGFVDENKGTNRTPHFGISCCNQNKCVMPALQDIPDELKEYFTADTPKAKQFRKYCRRFNSGCLSVHCKLKMQQWEEVQLHSPHRVSCTGELVVYFSRRLQVNPAACKRIFTTMKVVHSIKIPIEQLEAVIDKMEKNSLRLNNLMNKSFVNCGRCSRTTTTAAAIVPHNKGIHCLFQLQQRRRRWYKVRK